MPSSLTDQVQPKGPVASSVGSSARLESCTILDVTPEEYTVDIITEFSNRRIDGVPLMATYCHSDGPDGIYFLPEPGASAQILWPSDGGRERIIAYEMPMNAEIGARGGRPVLNPGDIYLASRDQNHVALRRGGLIEVSATALAQRMYIPVGNVIRDIFAQYEARSLLGDVSWKHSPLDPEAGIDDEVEVLYTFNSKQFVADDKVSITLRLGHVPVDLYEGADTDVRGAAEQTYLELVLDPQGEGEVLTWRIDSAGNIYMRTDGGASIEIKQAVRVKTFDSVNWKGAGGLEMAAAASGELDLQVKRLGVDSHTDIVNRAKTFTVDSGDIRLGGSGVSEQAVLGNELVAWLKNHTHYGAGTPSSGWRFKTAQVLSTAVKLK